MGGAIGVTIAVLATFAFYVDHSNAMVFISGFVALVCLWTWLHMWYFARRLARQRLYVAAVERGEIVEGSPEADHYWRVMPIIVGARDIQDVPDWITSVSIIANLAAVALLIWGGIAALL